MSERLGFNPEEDSGVQIESPTIIPKALSETEVDERVRRYFGDFDKEQLIESLESDASLMYIEPSQPGDDEVLARQGPTVIAPGWTETNQTFADEAYALAEKGRSVLIPGQRRYGQVHESPEELGLDDKGVVLTKAGFQRSLNLLNALSRSGFERVSAVGHSQGCVDVLVAALIDPEQFKDGIVLVNPPLLEKDTFPELMARFTPQLALKNDQIAQNIPGTMEALKNVPRGLSEAWSVAGTDLLSLAYEVRELGVPLTLVLGEDDGVFPTERILPRLNNSEGDEVDEGSATMRPLPFDRVTVMEDFHHNSVHQNPEDATSQYLDDLKYMAQQGRAFEVGA